MKIVGVVGLTAFGNLLGGWAGLPWQALLAYTFFAALCSTLVACAQVIVPQNSEDRVLWWRLLLNRRRSNLEHPARRK